MRHFHFLYFASLLLSGNSFHLSNEFNAREWTNNDNNKYLLRQSTKTSISNQNYQWMIDRSTSLRVKGDQDEETSTTLESSTLMEVTVPTKYNPPSSLHKIHVQSFLTEEEANQCMQFAKKYAKETGCFSQTSDRHVSYKTVDFEVEDCEELSQYLGSLHFYDRMMERMGDAYGLNPNDLNCLDFFCAQYEAKMEDNKNDLQIKYTMDHLKYHRDESLLSFTVLLSDPNEFEGGGTIFDCLHSNSVYPANVSISGDSNMCTSAHVLQRTSKGGIIRAPRKGNCVLHSGKMLHGADKVISGIRTVLVGFVDVAPYVQTPGALKKACTDWGRMDVAKSRSEYQNKQKLHQHENEIIRENGAFLQNQRWLKKIGRSHIHNFVPFFSTVSRRGNDEYQRKQRLKIEDSFLHCAIRPKIERLRSETGSIESFYGDDVTILHPVNE